MQNLIPNRTYQNTDAIDLGNQADTQDVVIDTKPPVEERARSYFRQKNPYCYKCDDTIVRVAYAHFLCYENRKKYTFIKQERCK